MKNNTAFGIALELVSEISHMINSVEDNNRIYKDGTFHRVFEKYWEDPVIKKFVKDEDYNQQSLTVTMNAAILHTLDKKLINTSAFEIACKSIDENAEKYDPKNFIAYHGTVYPAILFEAYLDRIKHLEKKVTGQHEEGIIHLTFMVAMHYLEELGEND